MCSPAPPPTPNYSEAAQEQGQANLDAARATGKLGVAITRLKDTESAELVASLRTTHRNDVVLVVAHSHTIPEILKLLGHAPVVTIGASEFDNLFAIVPRGRNTPPTVVRLRY